MLLQLNQARTFNPQLIDMVAAEVFWGYCHQTMYETARNCVLRSEFARLWTLPKAAERLRRNGDIVSNYDVKRFYDETNDYMQHKASREDNIIGTLYTEDFGRCRPPKFPYKELVQRLRRLGDGTVETTSGPVEVMGDLLIRTPLPAVVLLRERPQENAIQVSDTRKALGFQKLMLLFVRDVMSLPDNPHGYVHCATGVLQIPCGGTARHGWIKLIANSNACEKVVLC
jgi:hypothetical protein